MDDILIFVFRCRLHTANKLFQNNSVAIYYTVKELYAMAYPHLVFTLYILSGHMTSVTGSTYCCNNHSYYPLQQQQRQ